MAWNTFSDARRNCRQCNQYRVMNPFDSTRKQMVLAELENLQRFFDQRLGKMDSYPSEPIDHIIITKQNGQFCRQLIAECKECDRSLDRVNRDMVMLK